MTHNEPAALFADLLKTFQFAVLEQQPDQRLEVLGHPPAWLLQLYPETCEHGRLDVDGRMPVLENFMIDAEAAWRADNPRLIRSGFWTESRESEYPWHLEAMAFRHGDRRLLLIQRCNADYDQQLTLLQAARERMLHHADRERDHRRAQQTLTTQLDTVEQARDDVEAILQQLGLATLLIDQEGQVRFFSAAAAQLLGVESRQEDRSWERWLPLTKADHSTLHHALRASEPSRERLRCHLDTPAGHRLWLEIDVRNDPRDARRKIVSLHNVTDVHHLRRMLDMKAHCYDLIGKSRRMTQVYELIHNLARVDSTVLIEGETGTGKELVARALHQAGPRATRPFIAANCAGLTDSLLGSQLFGHKRGAFTGAIEDHQGLFEAAHGGVLFLDEIGDVPHTVQTSLLRVLQEREVTRLGESKPRKVDVRVVAATHHDLSRDVAAGTFRADLLYRIRVARIHLPPLRERKEDIPLLVTALLAEARAAMGKEVERVDPAAMAALMDYEWPGNVRELKSTIEWAVIRCRIDHIELQDLPVELQTGRPPTPAPTLVPLDERSRFVAALGQAHGNRTKAAQLLGMSRATFYRRLTELQLPTS